MFAKPRVVVSILLLFLAIVECSGQERRKVAGRKCPRKRIIEESGSHGTISTPGYPKPYKLRQVCLWRILVPKGYGVFLDFHDKFGIDCKSNDRVVVSSKRLFYKSRPRGDAYTALFCGVSRIPNVTVPNRVMWVRFQAHSPDTGGIGFKATYTKFDNDECKGRRHGCEQNCINTPGSYRCSCNRGYELEKNGFNCTVVPEYKVKFEQNSYNISISKTIPKFSKVLTTKAHVEGTNKPIRYSLTRRYPKPNKIRKYPFRISPDTGEITTRRQLKHGINEYQMTVKAQVNSKSYAKVIVRFNVRKISANITEIKFASPHYSVIISDNLKRGKTVLHLSLVSPGTSRLVLYNISQNVRYFTIDKDTGKLVIKQDLSKLRLHRNSSRRFEFTVVARLRDCPVVTASVIINVIVIPAHSGDIYRRLVVTKESQLSNIKSSLNAPRAKSPPKAKRSEFGYHRFFRQLSPTARDISRAERKFARVIHELRENVIQQFTDPRLRSAGPIISNLETVSLASPEKLQEIINESQCVVPKVDCSDHITNSTYRTFDGTCNNLENPLWGAANVPYNRIIKARYWDTEQLGEPVGFPGQEFAPPLPSPHVISTSYVLSRQNGTGTGTKFSHMMMQWGQFIDHDITFTAESEGSESCEVPRCDGSREDFQSPCYPIMYPGKYECTMFTRSAAACQTDPKNIKPREQLNLITSYIDGSQIYGSSLKQANSLRDLTDDRGYLSLDPTHHLLPQLKRTLNPPLNLCEFSAGCFAAGDLRANEQIVLASMHTMWAREHNRLATFLKSINPHWNSEKLFQESRKIVIAELQHITFNEYLPKLLGKDAIPAYQGYIKNLDATIFNGFAASAFRAGHSMVRPGFAQLDENYDPIGPDIPLVRAFFNNRLIYDEGIEPFILGLLANVSQTVDRGLSDGLTKHLFQQPGSEHGFDLAALNIQRGRDHGLPGYGSWRRECGLLDASSFDETQFEIKNQETRDILRSLYQDDPEHMDLWVGGLAEDHFPGAMIGPTFYCIIKKQFLRLRDGDRFWYENPGVFTKDQLHEIKKVTLSRVICDNLYSIISVQKDAFLAATRDSQRVGCLFGLAAMNMSKWKDEKGRTDIVATSAGHWSEWFYTKKTATGSWGAINRYAVCRNYSVLGIECETADGKKAETLGEKFTCDSKIGFYCRNIEQDGKGKTCSDYRFKVLCSTTQEKVLDNKPQATGFPSTALANPTKCDPKFRTRFPVITNLPLGVSKEITLFSPFENHAGAEYLYLGRNENGDNHRFLIQFNLRRVPRRSMLLSAFLQLFLVDVRPNKAGVATQRSEHVVEVFPITSTDWEENNVTSVIPWNEDYLGLDSDVDKGSLAKSDSIQNTDKQKWLNINVFQDVYNWRISRRRRVNYGVMVKLANEPKTLPLLRFASNSHENPSIRPKISVCLYFPPW